MAVHDARLAGALGARAGLSGGDVQSLELIAAAPQPMTPGQIAAAMGLTSGAVTGLVDRLECAGFVQRIADPADRRKLRVVVRAARVRELRGGAQRLTQRMAALWSGYGEDDLRTMIELLRRSADLASSEISRIEALPPLPAPQPQA